MSKFSEQLRAIRVFNNYEMLKQFGGCGDVTIDYTASDRTVVHHTSVWSPYAHTDLNPPQFRGDQYSRDFIGKRSETFQLAINWAMERFGHDYVVSPFGGRLPAHVVHKAKQAVRKAAELVP